MKVPVFDATRTGDPAARERAPSVRVCPQLGSERRSVTVVFVHGQHDFASRDLLARTLAPLRGHVLVDLSWCTFVDSSVISTILARHGELTREGGQLELIVPRTNEPLTRTFRRLGASALLPVHDGRPRIRHASPSLRL